METWELGASSPAKTMRLWLRFGVQTAWLGVACSGAAADEAAVETQDLAAMGAVPVAAPSGGGTDGTAVPRPAATPSAPPTSAVARAFQTEEERLAALCRALCSPLSPCEEGRAEECVSECFGGLMRPGCTRRYADVIECLIEVPKGELGCSPFNTTVGVQCREFLDALHACDENPEPPVPGPVGAPTNPSCTVTLSSTSTTCEQRYTCTDASLAAACQLIGDDWSCDCSADGVFYASAGAREPVVPRDSPCERASFACGMSY